MKPTKQSKLYFDNKCNCLVDYELLEKAMLWFSEGNIKQRRTIYLHGKYPAVSVFDKKIHVHRLLAMYREKSCILFSIHAHHIDGNKLNACLENIQLVIASSHISYHNKGRKLSEDHKLKISAANKGRKGIVMKKKYNINLSDLKNMLNLKMSINSIAKHYGCDWSVIKNRINQNPELLNN